MRKHRSYNELAAEAVEELEESPITKTLESELGELQEIGNDVLRAHSLGLILHHYNGHSERPNFELASRLVSRTFNSSKNASGTEGFLKEFHSQSLTDLEKKAIPAFGSLAYSDEGTGIIRIGRAAAQFREEQTALKNFKEKGSSPATRLVNLLGEVDLYNELRTTPHNSMSEQFYDVKRILEEVGALESKKGFAGRESFELGKIDPGIIFGMISDAHALTLAAGNNPFRSERAPYEEGFPEIFELFLSFMDPNSEIYQLGYEGFNENCHGSLGFILRSGQMEVHEHYITKLVQSGAKVREDELKGILRGGYSSALIRQINEATKRHDSFTDYSESVMSLFCEGASPVQKVESEREELIVGKLGYRKSEIVVNNPLIKWFLHNYPEQVN
jgi:hypothetical protein